MVLSHTHNPSQLFSEKQRLFSTTLVVPFESSARQNFGEAFKRFESYNSPATIATELFKPSTDSASLLVSIKKIT